MTPEYKPDAISKKLEELKGEEPFNPRLGSNSFLSS